MHKLIDVNDSLFLCWLFSQFCQGYQFQQVSRGDSTEHRKKSQDCVSESYIIFCVLLYKIWRNSLTGLWLATCWVEIYPMLSWRTEATCLFLLYSLHIVFILATILIIIFTNADYVQRSILQQFHLARARSTCLSNKHVEYFFDFPLSWYETLFTARLFFFFFGGIRNRRVNLFKGLATENIL